MPTTPRRSAAVRTIDRLATGLLGLSLLITFVAPASPVRAAEDAESGELQPTIHYEDAVRHANDRIAFAPGERVSIGFRPREGDVALVGGAAPRALPAGRLSGTELRRADPRSVTPVEPAPSAPVDDAPAPAKAPDDPADPTASPGTATPSPSAAATPAPDSSAGSDPTDPPPVDVPSLDPAAVVPAVAASTNVAVDDGIDLTAQVSPAGLRKEIFGFMPYWELSDSSTVLDFGKLSTIAYFGVGASAAGNLEKTSGGETTVGWSGWTSARMTTLINDAHRNHTRVVLTVQSFAWSTAGANKQRSLLGSATARANLAKTVATTIRDRGADGVNLDFEPIASGYAEEFTALVRSVRAELDKVQKGYQLTFDTTGSIGNYPLEAATAAGGADAIFIMGYDYRQADSAIAGSIAPLRRTGIDIIETLDAYTARVPASKLILGVPYYGRAWSTASDALRAAVTDAEASSSVTYANAVAYLADHGRRYDATEGVAWTAYQKASGWRQLYVDDAQALKAKYDLVNDYGLRGAGIWALGYDGSRTELWTAIRDKFITDSTAPRAGLKLLTAGQGSEAFPVAWASDDDFAVKSHDVDVAIDGGAWARWLSGTTRTSATYVGARGHAFAFRVRARDHKGNTSSWTGIPAGGAPAVKAGGFGRVVTDVLNARSAAGTGNTVIATLETGDVLAFLEGPKSANGYTWYRVAAPLTEWGIVGSARSDLWIATGDGSEAYVAAVVPPNTTKVAGDATRVSTAGAEWYPIDPVRLLDTRSANGLSGTFSDEAVRTFQLTGRGTVPVDAVAVTANLTVTGATKGGYVSIGPSMTSSPTTSTINVPAGTTLANGLTLRIGSGGKVSAVFVSSSGGKAHLILDVTGYYRVGGSGATWHALKPTRLLDSRSGNGLSGRFRSRTVRTVQIAGRGSVPSDALAVTGNLTATGATSGGYVSIGPSMTSAPKTSTLNIAKGVTRANNVTLRLSGTGRAGLVFVGASGSTAHLVFDVTGYYRAGNAGAEWYPIDPVRLLDTRSANGLSGTFSDEAVRTFQLTGRGTVPVDAVAVTANLTVTGATKGGYVSIGPSMTSSPTTSTINVPAGTTLANGLTLRIGSGGKVSAVFVSSSGARIHSLVDLTGYFR